MKSKYRNEIVVNAKERKHANFGTLAIVEPNGTALVTEGGRARVYEDGTAIVLHGGTVEHVEGALVSWRSSSTSSFWFPPMKS